MEIRNLRWRDPQLDKMAESQEVVKALEAEAQTIASRVSAPSHLRVYVRSGVSDRSAFSQTVLWGRAAVAIEFGSRNNAPMAPLRRALGSGGS